MDVDGAAVVLHSGSDDYRTDPAGASGNPIACGVVSG
jgi:superoxide dismutase, Cu-Zn family